MKPIQPNQQRGTCQLCGKKMPIEELFIAVNGQCTCKKCRQKYSK